MPTLEAGSAQFVPVAQEPRTSESNVASADPMLALLAGMWTSIFQQQVVPETVEGAGGWQLGAGQTAEESIDATNGAARFGIADSGMGKQAINLVGVSGQVARLLAEIQASGENGTAMVAQLAAEVSGWTAAPETTAAPKVNEDREAREGEVLPVLDGMASPVAPRIDGSSVAAAQTLHVAEVIGDPAQSISAPGMSVAPMPEQKGADAFQVTRPSPRAGGPSQIDDSARASGVAVADGPERMPVSALREPVQLSGEITHLQEARGEMVPIAEGRKAPDAATDPNAEMFVTELGLRKRIGEKMSQPSIAIEARPEIAVARHVNADAGKTAWAEVGPVSPDSEPVAVEAEEMGQGSAIAEPGQGENVEAAPVAERRPRQGGNEDQSGARDGEAKSNSEFGADSSAAKGNEAVWMAEGTGSGSEPVAASSSGFAGKMYEAAEAPKVDVRRPAPAKPVEVPQSFSMPSKGEAKTISIRIPLTEADRIGGQRRHLDVVFQHRNQDVTLQIRTPSGELQRSIEDSIPALMERLRGEDWTSQSSESTPVAMAGEVLTESRRRPDAMVMPSGGSEVYRETAPANPSSSSGFSFDDAPSGGGQESSRQQGRNPKRQQEFQAAFEEQQD